MKTLLLFTLMGIFGAAPAWELDLKKAQEEATESKKMILLNFSGSDWCGPCMRLKKEIFETDVFKTMATKRLVLVNADFPRTNKNKLPDEQIKKNEEMAEKYNPQGKFPFTVLMDATGKVKKQWDGFPDESADKFVEEINNAADAGK